MLIGTFIIKKTLPNLSKALFLQPAALAWKCFIYQLWSSCFLSPGAPAGPWLRRGKAWNKMPSVFCSCPAWSSVCSFQLGQPTRWWQRGLCCSEGSPARAVFVVQAISEGWWLFFGQNCIATHESNGIDIITALILNDINPLGKKRMDLVLELKASECSVWGTLTVG